jgi:hypothetical protein
MASDTGASWGLFVRGRPGFKSWSRGEKGRPFCDSRFLIRSSIADEMRPAMVVLGVQYAASRTRSKSSVGRLTVIRWRLSLLKYTNRFMVPLLCSRGADTRGFCRLFMNNGRMFHCSSTSSVQSYDSLSGECAAARCEKVSLDAAMINRISMPLTPINRPPMMSSMPGSFLCRIGFPTSSVVDGFPHCRWSNSRAIANGGG